MPNFGKTGKKGKKRKGGGGREQPRNQFGELRSAPQSRTNGGGFDTGDYPADHKWYIPPPEEWGFQDPPHFRCGTIVSNHLLATSIDRLEDMKAQHGNIERRDDGFYICDFGAVVARMEELRLYCCRDKTLEDIKCLSDTPEEWHLWMGAMVDYWVHRKVVANVPIKLCDAPASADEHEDGDQWASHDPWGRGK